MIVNRVAANCWLECIWVTARLSNSLRLFPNGIPRIVFVSALYKLVTTSAATIVILTIKMLYILSNL